MALTLGKDVNRSYNLRLPFMDQHVNIGVYFNKFSNLVLFKVDKDSDVSKKVLGVKINFFKNIALSKFANNILDLHNYKNKHIDILNQYIDIKDKYKNEIRNNITENIYLSKYTINEDKDIYESLTLYGFCLNTFPWEYIYIIAERQHIVKKMEKKFVRSTAMQIGVSNSLEFLDQLINKE